MKRGMECGDEGQSTWAGGKGKRGTCLIEIRANGHVGWRSRQFAGQQNTIGWNSRDDGLEDKLPGLPRFWR